MAISILALHRTAGVYTSYTDIDSLIAFFNRTGRATSYQIIVIKGSKALNIEKIDNVADFKKQVNDFIVQS